MRGWRRSRASMLLAATLLFGAFFLLRGGGTVLSESRRPKLPPSTSSLCFRADSNGWLRFDIPLGQQTVKVLSNATTRLHASTLEAEELVYSFDYRYFDTEDRLVDEGRYFVRSSAESFRDLESGAVYPSHFFGGLEDTALSTRTAVLNLRQYPVAIARIDLRRGECGALIEDVFVRAYYNAQPAGYKFRYLWRRLPPVTQERLARGNVYGAGLLSEAETENLLRNRWSGLVPRGVEGEDFDVDRLYAVQLPPEQKLRDSVLPRGLVVRRDEIGVITVGDGGGCLRLELFAVEGPFSGGEVHVTAYAADGGDPVYRCFELLGATSELVSDTAEGVIEVVPSIDVVVRAFVDAAPAPLDVTPSTVSRPAYVVAPGRGVTFGLEGYDVVPLPFRLELRRLLDVANPPNDIELRYDLVDGGGRILQRGSIRVGALRSWHDRLRSPVDSGAISDGKRVHFWIPPGIARLRFSTDAPGLVVSAATGLPGVPKLVRVGRAPDVERARSWFPLRPQGYEEFVERGEEVFIRVQDRPPLPEREGDFEYEPLLPRQDVLAAQLLAPRSDAVDIDREESLFAWSALEPGVVSDVYFGALAGSTRVEPELLVIADPASSSLLECEIDGTTVLADEIRGATSRFELPPVAVGWKEVVLRTERPVRAFVRGGMPSDAELFWIPTVYSLGEEGLTFEVEKSGEEREVVVFQVFVPPRGAAPLRLRAQVGNFRRAAGVYESWTYPRKVFEIWPDAGRTFPVLASRGRFVAGGERFVVVLGSDMPPGLYEIELRSEKSGEECLVRASHRWPGERWGVRVFREDLLPYPGDDED